MQSTLLERQEDLANQVCGKWMHENYHQRLHLEQYGDELYPLLRSRMQKMTEQIHSGELELPRLGTAIIDEIFQEILESGMITPIHPKESNEQEKRELLEEAAAEERFAQFISDSDFKNKIRQLEMHGGQREVSQWLHSKATPDEQKQFQRVFDLGVTQPEAPTQGSLYIVHGARKQGGVDFVSNDTTFSTARSREDAIPLGRTRAENAAEFLRRSGQYLNVIIEPVN